MLKDKVLTFILLTTVFVSIKAYCQQEIENQHVRTVIGKITKIDVASGAVDVGTGSVLKQAFLDAHLNADIIWEELIESGYIDANGVIQAKFYELNKFSDMILSKDFNAKKKLICDIFQKALIDHGPMVFYISIDSDLLQGAHHIASIEIEPGDPVTVQYEDHSSGKNNIIRLVDNRSGDE